MNGKCCRRVLACALGGHKHVEHGRSKWALKCCLFGAVLSSSMPFCIIEQWSANLLCVMKRLFLCVCDDFLFFFYHVCHHSSKTTNLKLCGVWLIEKIWRPMKATDQLWTLFFYLLPLFAWPVFSSSLYNLCFIPHIVPSLHTGLPPPPAFAKRGLKTRGKLRLPSHHTYSIHIYCPVPNLNRSNIV